MQKPELQLSTMLNGREFNSHRAASLNGGSWGSAYNLRHDYSDKFRNVLKPTSGTHGDLHRTIPRNCHPERVIKLLHHIVFIAHNMPIFGCVGAVQGNCANLGQFGCYRSLGHEESRCVAPSSEVRTATHRVAMSIRDVGS
jgi:hypothetical protein